MKSQILVGLLIGCACASAAEAGTLNLSYRNGYVSNSYGSASCRNTDQDGVRHNEAQTDDGGVCRIDIPIAIEAGKKVSQVTVFYGNEANEPEAGVAVMDVTLLGQKFVEGPLPSNDNNPGVTALSVWGFASPSQNGIVWSGTMYSHALLGPGTSEPGYESGFVTGNEMTYYAVIQLYGPAQFHGLRVEYDDDEAAAGRRSAPSPIPRVRR